jgi:hypothetical protein
VLPLTATTFIAVPAIAGVSYGPTLPYPPWEPVNGPIDLQAIEAALDCIAGGSMYVTRACLEKIGPMDERFVLRGRRLVHPHKAEWLAVCARLYCTAQGRHNDRIGPTPR